MKLDLSIDNAANATIPTENDLSAWITLALGEQEGSIHLRVVSREEIQSLNAQYRQKDKPTNVLSFPNLAPKAVSDGFLGDMVICADVLASEATAQHKSLQAHWAHMVIHSTLHLLGFDHETQAQAQEMEALEIDLLNQLGYPNPYIEVNHG